jgi:hypothetical protein
LGALRRRNAERGIGLCRRRRRKRNDIDYTRSHVATLSEANAIVQHATEFDAFVEAWIPAMYPNVRR